MSAASALLWRQKQFVDFLATKEVQDAWTAYYNSGSGPTGYDPSDPTAAKARDALSKALVDGFATEDAAAKLRGLAPGSEIADLQRKLSTLLK